jgi:hypothetical protein
MRKLVKKVSAEVASSGLALGAGLVVLATIPDLFVTVVADVAIKVIVEGSVDLVNKLETLKEEEVNYVAA